MHSLLQVTHDVAQSLFSGLVDSRNSAHRRLLILGGFLASGLRLAAGTVVGKLGPRPQKPLILWDCEGSASARAVRETLSTLDLDAEIRPCPQGGARFWSELGGESVPRLEDPNTGEVLSEPRSIVDHLHATYGLRAAPWLLNWTPVRAITGLSARALTGGRGEVARPSRAPARPLELWSFESSPYCRLVRSVLTELELPYVLHNVAKGSPRRGAFVAQSGDMQVPWLRDPNTGTELFESQAIERYLEATYGGWCLRPYHSRPGQSGPRMGRGSPSSLPTTNVSTSSP